LTSINRDTEKVAREARIFSVKVEGEGVNPEEVEVYALRLTSCGQFVLFISPEFPCETEDYPFNRLSTGTRFWLRQSICRGRL